MRWTLNHTLSALFALQAAALIWSAGEPPPRLDLLARVVDPGASARAQSSAKSSANSSAQSVVDAALASVIQVKIERRLDKPKRAPSNSIDDLFKAKPPEVSVLELRRDQDNNQNSDQGAWRVTSASLYPALADPVNATLRKLLSIQLSAIIASSSAHHKRLRVSERNYDRRVTLRTSSGVTRVYLGFGTVKGSTHVRLAGEDRVYLAHQFTLWRDLKTELEDLIDRDYIKVEAPTSVSVTGPSARRFNLERTGEGEDALWRLAGTDLDSSAQDPGRLRAFANAASAITIRSVMGPYEAGRSEAEYKLNEGATITVKSASGSTTYKLSSVAPPQPPAPEPANPHAPPKRRRIIPPRFYAHLEGSPFVIEVAESQARALLEQRIVDFSRASALGEVVTPPAQPQEGAEGAVQEESAQKSTAPQEVAPPDAPQEVAPQEVAPQEAVTPKETSPQETGSTPR